MKRLRSIDIAKGVGIFLIVLFHCDVANSFLFQFHVPFFAFLSGYVFNSKKYTESGFSGIARCLKSRICALYIPFVAFNLFYLAMHNWLFSIQFYVAERGATAYTGEAIVKRILEILTMGSVEGLLTPLWFLPCLLFTIIIYTVLRYICFQLSHERKKASVWTCLLSFVFSLVGYYIDLPRNINLALILLAWFALGDVISQYKIILAIEESLKGKRILIAAISTVCCAIIVAWVSTLRETWSSTSFLPLGYLAILVGGGGTLGCSLLIARTKYIAAVFEYMGRHTISILALHVTCFRLVDALQVALRGLPEEMRGMGTLYHNGMWIVLYPIIGIVMPLLLQKMFDVVKQSFLRMNGTNRKELN